MLSCFCLCIFHSAATAQISADGGAHPDQAALAELARLEVARVDLAEDKNWESLTQPLWDLLEADDGELVTRAADVLIDVLLQNERYDLANEVARIALDKDPDSALAFRFRHILPVMQSSAEFSADLGYRFEFDDNVTFPDEVFASGEEDFRHVFMADLNYHRPVAEGWRFYAQGNFLQSLHHDLDQFDQTRIAGSVAIGQTGRRFGWRFPVEVTHDRLDGDAFRSSLAALPGVYLQMGESYFSHFYVRVQSDDYDVFQHPDEDRSGDVAGAGVLVVGNPSKRLTIRGYLEFNDYDTDGAYWERDEIVAFLLGEFEVSPQWAMGFAIRYQEEDYDNVRPVFADRQQDESKEFYLNLTHRFADRWRWRAQVSLVDHESNIAVFDYERNVYSFSVVREF